MSAGADDKETFTAADMKALRLLAGALGLVAIALLVIAKGPAMQMLSIGLVILMMILCPLAIYALRRHQAGRK